jgi:hypothetical protein
VASANARAQIASRAALAAHPTSVRAIDMACPV